MMAAPVMCPAVLCAGSASAVRAITYVPHNWSATPYGWWCEPCQKGIGVRDRQLNQRSATSSRTGLRPAVGRR